ncbi:MAG: DUF4129 domain-containing protein [Janthinobacterium lividum]
MSRGFPTKRSNAARRVVMAAVLSSASALHGLAEQPGVSLATFHQQVGAAEQVVAGCGAAADACNADALPTALETVNREPGEAAFLANWQWLGEAIEGAKTSSIADRNRTMGAAQRHLAEWMAEAGPAVAGGPAAGGGSAGADKFTQARATAHGVLARSEFRAADGPSWLDRQVARLQDWFSRLFLGMMGLGSRNAWLAPLVEWSCFLLAAGGLLFFVRRSLDRQALRIALGEGAAMAQRTDRDAADWARLAEERAAAGEWREAIHCLYWAAIASLEARRAWRFNPTRTPREYLRLLRPGTEAERGLRVLTQTFERVWYGQAGADESEFRAAQAGFAALQQADLKRGDQGTTAAVVPAGAS